MIVFDMLNTNFQELASNIKEPSSATLLCDLRPTLDGHSELCVVAAGDHDGEGGRRAHRNQAQAVQVNQDATIVACEVIIIRIE